MYIKLLVRLRRSSIDDNTSRSVLDWLLAKRLARLLNFGPEP